MSTGKEDLVSRLCAFGLEKAQASVYFHLSLLGEAKAAEVAHASGRSRPDTYRALEALVQAGFARKSLERPVRFVAIPIDKALGSLLDQRQQELQLLDEARPELETLWPSMADSVSQAANHFAVHQGVTQVLGLLGRMLDEAKEEMTIATSPRLLQRLRPFTQRLLERAESGLRVRILAPVVRASDTAAMEGLVEHCAVRHTDLPGNLHMFFSDGRQMAFFVSTGRAASTQHTEETVLWLDAPDVVLAQEAVFDALWTQGVPLCERAQEIQDGTWARRVQVLHGRWLRHNRMREMFARAEASILVLAAPEELVRWESSGLRPLLDTKREDGVHVEIRNPADPARLGESGEASADGPVAVPLCAVVDDQEVLEVFGSGEEPGVRTHPGEWSIWSTHPEVLYLARQLLDGASVYAPSELDPSGSDMLIDPA